MAVLSEESHLGLYPGVGEVNKHQQLWISVDYKMRGRTLQFFSEFNECYVPGTVLISSLGRDEKILSVGRVEGLYCAI